MHQLNNFHILRNSLATLIAIAVSASVAQATVINVANPANFLTGATVTTATAGLNFTFTGNPQTIVDNLAAGNDQDSDFIFNNNGTNNRLSVSNFGTKSGEVDLRFFIAPADGQRVPAAITAYSSTANQTSTNISDYSLLGSTTVSGPFHPYDPAEPTGNGRGYFDMIVHLPAATQSLLIDLTGSATGARVYELQALPVPEPASCILSGLGAVGLVAVARRRREA